MFSLFLWLTVVCSYESHLNCVNHDTILCTMDALWQGLPEPGLNLNFQLRVGPDLSPKFCRFLCKIFGLLKLDLIHLKISFSWHGHKNEGIFWSFFWFLALFMKSYVCTCFGRLIWGIFACRPRSARSTTRKIASNQSCKSDTQITIVCDASHFD